MLGHATPPVALQRPGVLDTPPAARGSPVDVVVPPFAPGVLGRHVPSSDVRLLRPERRWLRLLWPGAKPPPSRPRQSSHLVVAPLQVVRLPVPPRVWRAAAPEGDEEKEEKEEDEVTPSPPAVVGPKVCVGQVVVEVALLGEPVAPAVTTTGSFAAAPEAFALRLRGPRVLFGLVFRSDGR